jgi:hypothetical protein
MIDRLSRDEIDLRIAALLSTRRTGQAVADYLERQHPDGPDRARAEVPVARLVQRAEAACSDG